MTRDYIAGCDWVVWSAHGTVPGTDLVARTIARSPQMAETGGDIFNALSEDARSLGF